MDQCIWPVLAGPYQRALNELLLAFHHSSDLEYRIEKAQQVLQHSVGEMGFFEWESEVEPV